MLLFLSSCAAVPGSNIKLENYPEVKRDIENISIGYSHEKFIPDKKGVDIVLDIMSHLNYRLEKKTLTSTKEGEYKSRSKKCIVKISGQHYANLPKTCIANYFIAGFTAFIIPYYCQQTYQIHATLVSKYDNRVLKEYDLKDKVNEIWSSLWAISWLIYEPESIKTPEYAKKITEEKLSEALVRSVLNDASNFSECRK